MSYESAKGYWAEHHVEAWLKAQGHRDAYRPRTTSYTNVDIGDIGGMPLVFSVKNQRSMRLGEWTDEMCAMVKRSPYQAGLVVHKRHGKGQVDDWYGTAPMKLWTPLLRAYVDWLVTGAYPI